MPGCHCIIPTVNNPKCRIVYPDVEDLTGNHRPSHPGCPSLQNTLWKPAERMLPLIRYPFIRPETLNHHVAAHPDFQRAAAAGPSGAGSKLVELVMRALFHQTGQRDAGWADKGWWTRRGNIRFTGTSPSIRTAPSKAVSFKFWTQ
jgi:hypothetical protein